MASARCRHTLHVMDMKSMVRLPRRWRRGHGAGDRADRGRRLGRGQPKHRYGGLHLTSRPPLAAYQLLAVPALVLIWRDHRPVGVLGLAVAGVVGWAALGQIDGVALVPVMVALYWLALTRPGRIAVAAGPGRPRARGRGR